jgi:hypothetical protein
VKFPLIETNLADAPPAVADQATVGASLAAQAAIRHGFTQVHIFNCQFIQDIRYGSHTIPLQCVNPL